MRGIIERSQRFLDRPLGLGPRIMLFVGALLLIPTHRDEPGLEPRWIPFAFGVLALLFLRAAFHGKVRDLVDVSVLAVYFAIFLVWTATPAGDFWGLVAVLLLIATAFVMARGRAHTEDVAETRWAG